MPAGPPITGHIGSEEVLERTRLTLQAIVDQSPVPIALVTTPGLAVTYANQAAFDILGVPEGAKYIGLTLAEIAELKLWQDYTIDGKPVAFDDVPLAKALRGITTKSEEYMIGRRDGTLRRDLVSSAPVYDRNGELIAAVLIFPDITEYRRAEKTAEENRERLALALQGADLGSWDWNVQTGQISVNERWAAMLGYTPSDFVLDLKSWKNLVHPEDLPRVRDLVSAHLEGRTPSYESEHRLHHTSGSWVWVLDKGKVISRDASGRPLRAVGTHLDITERKNTEEEKARLQEQLQQAMKMEAIGRLAGGIAHDFNNLLTAIIGNVDLARMMSGIPQPAVRCLEEIGTASERAAGLTRQLLAFSRRQVIKPQVVDLNVLIANLQSMMIRLIGEDVSFQAVLGRQLGAVKVDPGQFEQVLMNLAVNARDAMPDGGTLTIMTANENLEAGCSAPHAQLPPGRYVALVVSDTGHGMTEEVKRHVFEPFYTTKPQERGTGLGLATIFGIVKQAGGGIEVSSMEGKGTSFTIHLPIINEAAEALAGNDAAREIQQGHETVLLVEDEQAVRLQAARALRQLGYKVLPAADGTEALELARAHHDRIDLLMSDVIMPGLNGKELSERLLNIHPEMKILFVSGYANEVIADHGILEVNVNFLAKPYTIVKLAGKLRDVLMGS